METQKDREELKVECKKVLEEYKENIHKKMLDVGLRNFLIGQVIRNTKANFSHEESEDELIAEHLFPIEPTLVEKVKALKTDKYNIKNIMGEKYISIHDLANMSHST